MVPCSTCSWMYHLNRWNWTPRPSYIKTYSIHCASLQFARQLNSIILIVNELSKRFYCDGGYWSFDGPTCLFVLNALCFFFRKLASQQPRIKGGAFMLTKQTHDRWCSFSPSIFSPWRTGKVGSLHESCDNATEGGEGGSNDHRIRSRNGASYFILIWFSNYLYPTKVGRYQNAGGFQTA